MTTKIKELKSKNKELASLIKENKKRFKLAIQKFNSDPSEMTRYYEWAKTSSIGYRNLSREYRHAHIAYCLLRGRTFEQIENKTKPGNEPSWTLIENVMKEYREVEEIVCSEVANG